LIFLLYIFLVMLGLIPALVFCLYSSMPSYSVTYALINLSPKAFIVRFIYFFSLLLYHLCYFLLHVVMWPLTYAYPLRHFLFAE
jgi:hypothetical protein